MVRNRVLTACGHVEWIPHANNTLVGWDSLLVEVVSNDFMTILMLTTREN